MEELLKKMTFPFFATGSHKIPIEKLLQTPNVVFLDVRSDQEAASLTLGLAHHRNVHVVHIPIDQLPDRIDEVPKDKLIGAFCPAQVRSTMAFMYLLSQGFSQVRIIEGGYPGIVEAVKPGKVLKAMKS